jgi:DnaJ-class molecular chaperone
MRDPYQVLGVSQSASEREIKQAYRKLAKELHPDTNPDDPSIVERFKEVSAAYALLGDAEQRGRYDRGEIDADGQPKQRFHYEYAGGPQGTGPGAGFGGFRFDFGGGGAEDLFAEVFRGRDPRQRGPRRGADRAYRLNVSFIEAARGGTRRINLPGGKTLDVRIPAGIESGRNIRLRGQGEPGPGGGPAGDALIEVTVETHPYFRREGADIHLDVPISLAEAVGGAKIEVPTIDGPVQLTVPKHANAGRRLRLKNRGIQQASARGDQYVILKVMLPETPDARLDKLAAQWGDDYGEAARRKAGLAGTGD